MKLGAFLYPTGYHVAAWRSPGVQADAGINFKHFASLAATAEEGKFDFIFLADSAGVRGTDLPALSRQAIRYIAQFEPFTLLSALAAVTNKIGLIASATSTYNEPYHIARKFASLDHISGGRAGWNLVTSQNEEEAYNFSADKHPAHADRYERAKEFAEVVKGLWDTWEDDAFPRNKASGIFFDVSKLHVLNHKGKYFSVKGPLNVPRSPQGHPVIVQSGSSEAGKELAGESGEVVFTAQQTFEGAQAFYKDVKARALKHGRSANEVIIMPGIFPIIGKTQEEAVEKHRQLQLLIDPVVGLSLLSGLMADIDLSKYPLDGPLPELPETNAGKSRQQLLIDLAKREQLSIRQLYMKVAGSRGHWDIIGTPESIADQMEYWVTNSAADGFCVIPPLLPQGLEDFVNLVIPELRRRNLFREDYESSTLRGHLGLPRPEHFVKQSAATLQS
jgi:N-acetyl-S-(2-succino)cysteine monooxygenase